MSKKAAGQQAQEYEQHPVATELMPGGMSNEEFDAFCEDIEQRGIIQSGTLCVDPADGKMKVLDGWHRYRASLRTGTRMPPWLTYEGKDPAGYVVACNALRRKLSSLQKALVGARIHLNHAVSQRDVCRRLSISNTVLTMVLKAIDNRCTAIIRRIENDSDYTRGMLREELEELQIVHANYGRSKAKGETEGSGDPDEDIEFTDKKPEPDVDTKRIANSAFDMSRILTTALPDGGNDEEDPEYEHLPEVGTKPTHPERRAKSTAAENMKKRWHAMDEEDQKTLVQMLWGDIRPLAQDLGLLGTSGKAAPWDKAKNKNKKEKA